jgi:hypothetical protein
MNNIKIQESLIEIEENLKHLDSARNQVLSVTDSSYKLSEKVLHLATNFQELKDNLSNESNTIVDELGKHNIFFKERVNVITDSIDTSVNSLVDKINASSLRFSIDLDDVSKKHISSSEKLIVEKEKILDSLIEKHQSLSKSIDKIDKELKVLDFHKKTEEVIILIESQRIVLKSINVEIDKVKKTIDTHDEKITDFVSKEFQIIKLSHLESNNKLINEFTEKFSSNNDELIKLKEFMYKNEKKQIIFFTVLVLMILWTVFIK